MDARQVIATLPRALALSATGRIGTRHARLEHLGEWLAFEEDPDFTTVEKATLVEAITPHMGPATPLADGIAAYLAAHPVVSA